jgi:hypothetical protein
MGGSAGINAVTYRRGGKQRIYAFTAYGNLYVNYWDGEAWHWADQGQPSEPVVSNPSVVTYRYAGQRRIYAFVSSISKLYVNWWDGSQWRWADQGMPQGNLLTASPVMAGSAA